MVTAEQLAERVRLARLARRMSQHEFGQLLGASKQTVSYIEKGRRTLTALELQKISEAMQIPLDFFLGAWESLSVEHAAILTSRRPAQGTTSGDAP
jgi:transcriptional regulator with XRE-family HTH domain